MNYFETKIIKEPVINRGGTKKWFLDNAYTGKRKQLKEPFTKAQYNQNLGDHLFFKKLADEFVCANPDCRSREVKCIWYLYQGIDLSVDETFAEFYCPICKKYTFVEYYRDDS